MTQTSSGWMYDSSLSETKVAVVWKSGQMNGSIKCVTLSKQAVVYFLFTTNCQLWFLLTMATIFPYNNQVVLIALT